MKKYSFINPDPRLQNNLMAFGFDCGKGWYPLILETLDKIQELLDSSSEIYADFEIVQVTEKRGQLVIYANFYPKEIEDMLDDAGDKSVKICEKCGKDGKLRIFRGWYTTLCDDCSVETTPDHSV